MRHHWLLVAFAWAALTSSAVNAQEGKAPWEEFGKRIEASQSIVALSDDLFGDSISLANGGLSFSATDIEIPGNAGPRVAFGRRYTVFNHWKYTNTGSPLGDWDLDVPNISGVFAPNWTIGHPNLTSQSGARCSLQKKPTQPERDYRARDFWHGNILSIPGVGGGELLVPAAGTRMPTSGGPYPWITADHMRVSCLPTIKNGTGEGFLVVAPDGTKYWFDWMAQYKEPMLIMPGRTDVAGGQDMNPVQRRKNVLYATKVQDRFGNTVNYTFTNSWNAPAVLTKISASDGRQITLTYQSGKVRTATAGNRTWTYTYGTTPEGRTTLTQVKLPDSSTWQIGFSQLTDAYIEYRVGSKMEPSRSCLHTDPPLNHADESVGAITHPSGAKGTFRVGIRTHGRSNVPVACYNVTTLPSDFRPGASNDPNDDMNQYVISYDSLTLLSKTISGPGVTPKTWSYSYVPGVSFYLTNGATVMYPVCRPWSVAECVEPKCVSDVCAGSSQTTVAETGGKWARYTFGNSYRYNDGKLLKVERGSDASHILQTETNRYDLSLSDQAYPLQVGSSSRAIDEAFATTHTRPLLERTISQQGTTFNWQVAPGGCPVGSHCFDDLARPLETLHSSSISGNPVKTNTVTYHDDPALWVIGQVESTTTNGTETARTQFGWKALPWKTYRFGKLQSIFGYYTSGTPGSISSVTDGNGNKTWLKSWKRGMPQTITYPATPDQPNPVNQKATVDSNGWITSVTDENGFKTSYAYDPMGRLKKLTYPTGDSVAWNATNQSFAPSATSRFGLPAGHWVQIVRTGAGQKVIDYDAMWRPVVEYTHDTGSPGVYSIVVKRYDAAGRLKFQSYPSPTISTYTDASLKGTHYTYDALDRVTSVTQDSEIGPLTTTTEYLSGFQIRVTNPRGKQTLTRRYLAFDRPTYEWPRDITHPEGAYTTIYRNIFSKPWAIARFSAGNAVRQTRWYVYDDHQQLCKTIDDESRATVMHYDGAGNLDWSAGGLGLGSSTDCQYSDSRIAARKVTRSYDARNRIKSLVFPDHRGDTTYSYTPDSKLASITADNGATDQVTTQYTYNRRRLMTEERMLWNNINWPVTYVYNANGHLSAQKWHGLNITYAPNALGQPTQAGTYASNVTYHPNGAIKSFTYGNNITHTLAQNVRGLPDRSRDVYGSRVFLDDGYDYDQNGNVAAISDGTPGNPGDRTMTYDGLDRLTKTVAPGMFGTATYAYDVLDNLTRAKVTGGNQPRDHYYCYDTHWRLTNIKTGSCSGATVMGLGYDVQGNLANRNGHAFTFDYGNRLRTVSGPTTHYTYDGHGRRVRDIAGASKYSQYSSNGQLLQTSDGRRQVFSEYIYLQGSLVAIRERDTTTNSYMVKYQHTDALGSPVAVTSQSRTVLERREYEPYGRQLRPTAMVDGVGYTGHVGDAATGLVYMQQRYYDPGIGRFLSVDPVTALQDPVGSFNRYSYAGNNPINATDPDGRRCVTANSSSVYCMRRDIYRHFDRTVSGSTRFFGAAAATVEYLANSDIPGAGIAGNLGFGVSSEASSFLHGVSRALYSMNASTFSQIRDGSLSGAGLDAKLVHMEQTAVQKMLDGLPAEQRDRIVGSINAAFQDRRLANWGSATDRAYNKVLDRVERGLGRAVDFGKQSDREAIGNGLIKELRSSGACSSTGTRIKSC